MTFPLHLSGSVELFTDGIPDSVFMNMTRARCFLFAWIDKDRHQGAPVTFGLEQASGQKLGTDEAGGGQCRTGQCAMTLELGGEAVSELLKLQGVMRLCDSDSGNRRTVTVATGGLDMRELLLGKECSARLTDPFDPGNYIQVRMRASNASDYCWHDGAGMGSAQGSHPTIQIRATHLRRLCEYNKAVKGLSCSMQAGMKDNGIAMPPGGEMFSDGLSGFEWGGAVLADGTHIEPFTTHYAILGHQEQMWNRVFPVALPVYSLYLRLSHSGLTMQQVLQLPLPRRCELFLSGLGMSFDAGLVPYVRDFTTGVTLSMIQGFGIGQKTTENMALPCSAPQFLGRHIRQPNPIYPPPEATMDMLIDLIAGRVENMRCTLADDCESSAGAAVVALQSLLKAMKQGGDLRVLCHGFGALFAAWTAQDWGDMSQFVGEMVKLVENGSLSLSTVTGIATNASASDVGAEPAYNGHCFNVGRLILGDQPVHCFIVEGTAPLDACTVRQGSPTVMCQVTEMRGGVPQKVMRPLQMPDFLTRLGKTVTCLTQVINVPHGTLVAQGQGWPLREPLTGWLSSTIFSNALDSDPSFELGFYNRAMYTGWQCAQGGGGCLPVQESGGRLAGCHPYDLNKQDLRALSAGLPQELNEIMRDILDEANPPIAADSLFQQLARTWWPAASLGQMNRAMQADLEPGVSYHTVGCMESPGSQDYTPILGAIKTTLACEWNRLNKEHPNSDGIRIHAEVLGTGVTLKIRVPNRVIGQLTLVQTCLQAMCNVGWRGKIPEM